MFGIRKRVKVPKKFNIESLDDIRKLRAEMQNAILTMTLANAGLLQLP